ncbi:unnamed protein product, partial [Ectocarpus sp. 4 AP-2014]
MSASGFGEGVNGLPPAARGRPSPGTVWRGRTWGRRRWSEWRIRSWWGRRVDGHAGSHPEATATTA